MTIREKALKVAESQIGVTEVGRNWDPKVSEYLKATGISFPAAWCIPGCLSAPSLAGSLGRGFPATGYWAWRGCRWSLAIQA